MNQWLKLFGVAATAAVVTSLVAWSLDPDPGSIAAPIAISRDGLGLDADTPSALFVGDSFTAGSGTPSKEESFGCLTATDMGWVCNVDAQPGTGYVADGRLIDETYAPLVERLPATKDAYLADIVIVDAGRNDRKVPANHLKAAITTYLNAVRAAWPRAELVVIEPYFMNDGSPILRRDVLRHLRSETQRHRGHVINPHKQGWILRRSADRDLDAPGHRYIAQRLVAALRHHDLDDLEVTDRRLSAG